MKIIRKLSLFFSLNFLSLLIEILLCSFSFKTFHSNLRTSSKLLELIDLHGDGVTTRMQKEMSLLQHEFSQLDGKSDAKLDFRFQEFQEEMKVEVRGEIRSEMHSFFE